MSISSTHLFTLSFIATYLFITIPISKSESESELLSDLLTLQSQSKSSVIHLNDHKVSKFITSPKTPRPYYLLIFFDAIPLHDKPDLRLRDLNHEFALVASSFVANNHNNSDTNTKTNLFFCHVEFQESQSIFHLFGVNSLPRINLVGPTAKSMKNDPEQIKQTAFNRLTESLVDFIESRTKLTVGPIHRPPLVSRKQIGLVVGLLLIWFSFAAKKIFSGETMLHDPRVWLAGTVFVYFFSVSGTMHNIIRKMPLFVMEKGDGDTNKMVFFYKARELQFGLEGFAVGFLYTIVGLLLAFVTHVLVHVKDSNAKRVAMLFSVFVSFWAVKQVIILDNWKTGYMIHGYWPSKWT